MFFRCGGSKGKTLYQARTKRWDPAGCGQGGVTPMTSNVGLTTPVAGAESVGGAGMGGVGNAAKGMAKGVANGPTSSLDQAGGY